MAGSRKWFVYTSDSGVDFAIERDESLTEAVNGGTQDYADGVSITAAVPRNLKPRTLTYETSDGRQSRTVVALTVNIFNGALAAVPSFSDAGATFFLKRRVGETFRLPFAIDTGLNDGDIT